MVQLDEVYRFIDRIAPFSLQMDFDNAGLLVGDRQAPVSRVLVALDGTVPVIREAARLKCDLLVTHHPVIFHPVKALTTENTTAVKLLDLTAKKIAVISAHTNLDLAPGGVNDALADKLGLKVTGILEDVGVLPDGKPYGLGRIGVLPAPMSPADFARMVKKSLGAKGVRAALGDGTISRVAVSGGSCGDLWELAWRSGCDALVTADVKYDQFLDARQRGLTLIDGGHFATENPVVERLAASLSRHFAKEGVEVLVSKASREVYRSI